MPLHQDCPPPLPKAEPPQSIHRTRWLAARSKMGALARQKPAPNAEAMTDAHMQMREALLADRIIKFLEKEPRLSQDQLKYLAAVILQGPTA